MNPKTTPPARPILSVGDLVADLVVSIPALPVEAGQHQLAREIRLEPGGAANFLIAGSRLGQPMAALGALGADDWGERVAELLRTEGVELSRVRRTGTTTLVVVLVSQQGQHVFLGKYGHGDKIGLRPADVALVRQCQALYCAGYTLAEARLQAAALEAMAIARRHHRPVFFDPGPAMAEVPPAVGRKAVALANTLLLTEAEIPLLAVDSAAALLELGPETVVVKRGAAGCTIYPGRSVRPVDAPGYPVTVVDSAAAGDSFNAAYIIAAQWGWPPADCAKLANAVGAAKVRKLGGGRQVPTLAEVRSIIAEFEIDIDL